MNYTLQLFIQKKKNNNKNNKIKNDSSPQFQHLELISSQPLYMSISLTLSLYTWFNR